MEEATNYKRKYVYSDVKIIGFNRITFLLQHCFTSVVHWCIKIPTAYHKYWLPLPCLSYFVKMSIHIFDIFDTNGSFKVSTGMFYLVQVWTGWWLNIQNIDGILVKINFRFFSVCFGSLTWWNFHLTDKFSSVDGKITLWSISTYFSLFKITSNRMEWTNTMPAESSQHYDLFSTILLYPGNIVGLNSWFIYRRTYLQPSGPMR